MIPRAPGVSSRGFTGGARPHIPRPHVRESAPRLDALESILDEFGERWRRGEGPRAEDFVSRLGRCDPADVVELIYHEFCLAESSEHPPEPAEFLARFPQYRERLARLFGLRDALGSSRLDALTEPAEWPEPGGEIGPYILVRALGQGSFARVFLAEQIDLERRLVVVKVANRPSPEPRLLARAQHAHIVDVLRHGETEDGQLHLICMPFLGGATLADILSARAERGGGARTGRDFLADLDGAAAPEYPESSLERPAREILARLSYPKAVAWMIARLAEALDHAHSRGVTHGDLKPSNVLLTSDGRPMLFDFNLAIDWGDADARDDGGGTLAYMAPERLAAIAEPREGISPRPADRHRADIYALGLVLLEALTGNRPEVPDAPGLLPRDLASAMAAQRLSPDFLACLRSRRVPRGLWVILEHCLAANPGNRYDRASQLAEDLDRYRSDLPPVHVDEPAIVPRVARWARRQRLAIAAGVLVLAAGSIAALLASTSYRASLHDQAVAKLDALWNGHEPGVYRFRLYGQTFGDDPGDPVEVAERHLARYGVLNEPDWRTRDDVRYLDRQDRAELEAWMAEQVWRFAHALGERRDSPDDWRRGLHTLERALNWAAYAPLQREAHLLREKLGSPEPRDGSLPPSRVWQADYLEGVTRESADPSRALASYQRVLISHPDAFWPNYRAAVAQVLNDKRADAVESLTRCISRRPKNPALRVHRAGLLLKTDPAAALVDCNLALELDPDLPWAYNTRAIIQRSRGIPEARFSDLEHFRRLVRHPASESGLNRQPFSWVSTFPANPISPFAATDSDADHEMGREDSKALFEAASHWAQAGDLERALRAFDCLADHPDGSMNARFNRMIVLRLMNRPTGRDELEKLVDDPGFADFAMEHPETIPIYQQAAFDSLGAIGRDFDRAIELSEQGVEQANRVKAHQGESSYYLSRFYALAARQDPGYRLKALDQLKITLRYDTNAFAQWIARDPAFDDLRHEIRELMKEYAPTTDDGLHSFRSNL